MESFHSVRKMYYVLIAAIGVPVNLLAVMILSRGKSGLSTCTTRYLVAMAMADMLFIVTAVIVLRIFSYYFPGSFLDITPVCSVVMVLLHTSGECSVWFTVTFSFDRMVAICFQKFSIKYCTKKTASVVLTTTYVLLSLKSISTYFTFEPGEIINNVPWFCYLKQSYYTDPAWIAFDCFNKILTPLLPCAFVILFNAITVRYIVVASRVRKALKGKNKEDNCSDTEMEKRRKSVILLFTISGNFILLWLLYLINFLYCIITGINTKYYSDFSYIFREIGIMLVELSCCTNTFIYGITQSKFREQFKSAVKYPITSIINLIN